MPEEPSYTMLKKCQMAHRTTMAFLKTITSRMKVNLKTRGKKRFSRHMEENNHHNTSSKNRMTTEKKTIQSP